MSTLSSTVGRAFYGHFKDLRDIQRGSIDPILDGVDVLVLSPTGSGKTEAVLAPLVDKYLGIARSSTGPVIIYVTPTRALANDLFRRLEQPLETLGLRLGIRHGERNDLQRASKPQVLITTPESLDVMLMAREKALREVQAVLLDEVHLTYNTQRGLQLSVLLHRLATFLGRELQVAALSATVAADAEMWGFLRPGREFVTVRDDYSRPIDAQIRTVQAPADLGGLLEHLSTNARLKTLVFADSRRECDNLATALSAQPGLAGQVFVHHSALSRDMRLHVETQMQDASSAVCVATSTLELGIDIGDVDLVVLYGPPAGWESFLQRIGRGNRRGNKSNVLCLAVPGHGSVFAQALVFEALIWQVRGNRVEQRPAMELYGAAVQQLLSLVLEGAGGYRRVSELAAVFSPWPHLSSEVVEEMVLELVSGDFLHAHGFLNQVGAGPRSHQLRDLALIWGNFPAGSQSIPLRSPSRELGSIPVGNLARIRPGVCIRFAGRRWRVARVRRDAIEVEPAPGAGNEVEISYGGRRPSLDPANVEAMLLLLAAGIPGPHMPPPTAQSFAQIVDRLRPHVNAETLPVATGSGRFIYFTFGGRLLNEVIALHSGSSGYRAGDVALESVDPIDFTRLPDSADDLLPLALPLLAAPDGLTVFQQLLPGAILARELAEEWLKSPVYSRSIQRLRQAREERVQLQDLLELNF